MVGGKKLQRVIPWPAPSIDVKLTAWLRGCVELWQILGADHGLSARRLALLFPAAVSLVRSLSVAQAFRPPNFRPLSGSGRLPLLQIIEGPAPGQSRLGLWASRLPAL